jgi:glycosyltransferase involved in cell wall biosynthesis
MSFFQVQACGLPVLFEENEINNIRVSDGNAFTFPPGSIDSFREKVIWLASQPRSTLTSYSTKSREYALQGFDFVAIAKQYSEVLSVTVEKWNQRSG